MQCYAEVKARRTAVKVARHFVYDIVLRQGAPAALITDRSAAFTAELLQRVTKLMHINHRKTTADPPQINVLTERFNWTLADMLSMYVDGEHETSDEILPYPIKR